MPSKHIFSVRLTYLLILAALTLLYLMSLWAQHRTQAAIREPFGHCSAEQITTLAEALSYDLVPETTSLSFVSFPVTTYDGNNVLHRTWQVEYRDPTEKISGILEWNADTGQLEKISQNLPADPRFSGRLTSAQAAATSLYWIEKLQMASEKTCRLGSAPTYDRGLTYGQGVWQCEFYCEKSRVLVKIGDNDNRLLFAQKTEF